MTGAEYAAMLTQNIGKSNRAAMLTQNTGISNRAE
jgi:hypothetical protein